MSEKLTIEGKLYPNKHQARLLEQTLEKSRMLYNYCLDMKIKKYKLDGENLHRFEIEKRVSNWDLPSAIRNRIIKRLDLAYATFFRQGGFPRFKQSGRFRSFAVRRFKQDYRFVGGKIMFYKKYGFTPIKVKGLKELINPKEARIVKRASGWYVQIVDEIPVVAPKKVTNIVGIDYGLRYFVADSTGGKVKAPKVFRQMENKLAVQQRQVARKKKGSNNRRKTAQIVARTHERISNKRKDFLHKLSRRYSTFDLVSVEKLNIKGMVKNPYLSKSINDASWGIFTNMLRYKLQMLGGHLVEVNPYQTTQKCSSCGRIAHKTLSTRTHQCECGLVLDRDENASRNILALGLDKAIVDGIAIASRVKQEALN